MIKYFVLFILLFSNNVFAWEPLKIELENKNNNLRLYLINEYGAEVLVNQWLVMGPPFFSCGVTLEILDKEGKNIPFRGSSPVEMEQAEQNIILLWPRDIIGREYKIRNLLLFYNLAPGIYKARATYKNKVKHFGKKRVYSGSITSDWITFEVTEEYINNIREEIEARKK